MKSKTYKNLIVFIVLLVFFAGIVTYAAADKHLNGYSSVPTNRVIHYTGSAKYSSSFSTAISRWNGLGYTVRFEPHQWGQINDLNISEVSNSGVSWIGLYNWYAIGVDTIQYNNYYLDKSEYSLKMVRGIYTHELGHAVGIADHYEDQYKGIIMYGYGSYPNVADYLTSHDIADFKYIWDNL